MIVLHSGEAVTQWVARQLDPTAGAEYFRNSTSIGVLRDGKPIAGVVYSGFRELPHGNDIMTSIYGVKGSLWAKPSVLKALFRYPFEQLGCARITALVAENNPTSINFVKRVGFRREGVARRAWNGKTNALLFGMLKEECKYL